MRLDEWLVYHDLISSRSKANRFIRNNGVYVNTTQCTKPAYIVKKTDKIEIDENKIMEYSKPLGYQKLAFLVNQANIPFFPSDRVLDLGASAGGFCRYILERKIDTLYAVEISHQFDLFLREIKVEYSNFNYTIGDVFRLLPTLTESKFNLVTIDLTVDPIFLLDHIIELIYLARSNKFPARILCMLKIENTNEEDIILNEFKAVIEKRISDRNKLIFMDSLPRKKEKAIYLEFWTHIKES